ncbi:hypothetical protein BC938DRAFT_484203 [Jimgerdemannia flammicorona]|uniref:Uncharacterized protein n=1 Tax=Jimgerdemannia flammicorona TaxID=994334 RepID=A0A433QAB3_9FUNG|nr:hypothetical protein BC938DRAFT_484203 [Jimgerdemannia flammicorona]
MASRTLSRSRCIFSELTLIRVEVLRRRCEVVYSGGLVVSVGLVAWRGAVGLCRGRRGDGDGRVDGPFGALLEEFGDGVHEVVDLFPDGDALVERVLREERDARAAALEHGDLLLECGVKGVLARGGHGLDIGVVGAETRRSPHDGRGGFAEDGAVGLLSELEHPEGCKRTGEFEVFVGVGRVAGLDK